MTSGKKNLRHSKYNIAIHPVEDVYEWGTTLVIAHRTNTDFMGCGGAIALLRQMGYRVHVMFINDVHPVNTTSICYPEKCLQALRKYEIETALSKLNVSEESISFLNFQNEHIPQKGERDYEHLDKAFRAKFMQLVPDSILIPWRFECEEDHLSLTKLVHSALAQEASSANLIEYARLPWIEDKLLNKISQTEVKLALLDSKPVLENKLEALLQYHEEEINLFQDELPTLTSLNRERLSYMTHPWEIFIYTDQQ